MMTLRNFRHRVRFRFLRRLLPPLRVYILFHPHTIREPQSEDLAHSSGSGLKSVPYCVRLRNDKQYVTQAD